MVSTMRLLVLGGTRFVGRAVVEAALARGHEVTTFNRGRSGRDIDGATPVRGDRERPTDLRRLVESGPWDAVVDSSGYVPALVGLSSRELAKSTGRYVFVSTVSAYAGWPTEPLDEDSPLLECPPDAGADYGHDDPSGSPTQYGIQKAGCERAVQLVRSPAEVLIVRPGVILGPGEPVGRLPWWLLRMQRGGRVLAPGEPGREIQPIDARDVAGFVIDGVEEARAGAFNLTAPLGRDTFGTLLADCAEVAGGDVELSWVDDVFLVAEGVQQWTELPLWRTAPGTWAVSSMRAQAAGLRCRPLAETVRDTWAWLRAGGRASADAQYGEREHGLTPAREEALLAEWDVRVS
jgi:nucleoside-diphosphate-sugar epimerase